MTDANTQPEATPEPTPEPTEAELIKALETGEIPGQSPDPEPEPAPEPEPEPPAVDKVAEAFEANARLERQNREMKAQLAELEELKRAAEESPLSALEKLGTDPIELLEQMGATEPREPVEKVTSELEKLRADTERLRQELEQNKLDNFVRQRREALSAKIEEMKEEFPFASLAAKNDPLFINRLMEEAGLHYRDNQEILADEKLVELADKHVSDGFYGQLSKVLQVPAGAEKVIAELKKLQADALASENDDTPTATLTNDMSDTPTRVATEMTEAEAEAEFLRAMKEKGWVGDD